MIPPTNGPQAPPQKKKSDLEELLKSYINYNETRMKNQKASLKNLENQVRQIASFLSKRSQKALPSNTEKNLREEAKSVTLKNGRELEEVEKKKMDKGKGKAEKSPEVEISQPSKVAVEEKMYKIRVPFPLRLKQQQLDKQFAKFLKAFKSLHINIPFVDALAQMPSYAKFLKEILKNKRKLEDYKTIKINKECSTIIQNKLPPKLKDLGRFTIPYTIGGCTFNKVLCDLGASIILMPYFVM